MGELITIKKQSGCAFRVEKGQLLKIVSPQGRQVSDLVCFNWDNHSEVLDNGKTFDYEGTLRLTTGNTLYSNNSNAMLKIEEDTCGLHDFLLAPCCPRTMSHFYDIYEPHPSCKDNLYQNLKPYGIARNEIPTAFNIFMNVDVDSNLDLKVLPPKSKAGDHVIFRASMDLLVAATACSAKDSNGGSCKPIQYSVD